MLISERVSERMKNARKLKLATPPTVHQHSLLSYRFDPLAFNAGTSQFLVSIEAFVIKLSPSIGLDHILKLTNR